jgi:NAD(P)-dependent dehydrogenase (short-subunit alcohol dehydrogenase family)
VSMADLSGKVALVTGAARAPGMGRATALRLARDGADVVCVDQAAGDTDERESDGVVPGVLDSVAAEIRELGRRSITFELDPTDASAVQNAVDSTVTEFGRLDACCHFAGGTGPGLATGPLLDIDERAWDRCLDINLISAWLVAKSAAQAMVRGGNGGAIVVLSSFAARSTPEGYGAFAAARAGVVRLVEVLALELAASGIRANAVLPLGVVSDQPNPGLAELASRDGGLDEWVARSIPAGRLQSPDEVASVASFLCGGDASFVSGQAIAVSGGALR